MEATRITQHGKIYLPTPTHAIETQKALQKAGLKHVGNNPNRINKDAIGLHWGDGLYYTTSRPEVYKYYPGLQYDQLEFQVIPQWLDNIREGYRTQKRVNASLEYKKTVDQCAAVVRALEVVTVKLGYNLTISKTNSTPDERKHRRAGWHTFCRVIQLICKDFTMRGVDNALSVPGKPCREVLTNMFEVCRHECPHSEVELKRLID